MRRSTGQGDSTAGWRRAQVRRHRRHWDITRYLPGGGGWGRWPGPLPGRKPRPAGLRPLLPAGRPSSRESVSRAPPLRTSPITARMSASPWQPPESWSRPGS